MKKLASTNAGITRRRFIGNSFIGSSTALLATAVPDVLAESGNDSMQEKKLERIKTTAVWGHPQSNKVAGKRVWYRYASGYVFEQHYIDEETIVWKSIDVEGNETYTQEDKYHCFEIAPEIYLITWCEESTIASPAQMIQYPGAWPVFVVADFNRLLATVSFINPTGDGVPAYIIDQARLEIKE